MNFKQHILRPFATVGLATALAWTGLAITAPAPAAAAAIEINALSKADAIIATGNKYLGTPYQFGAPSGVTSVFDCSSFTQYVYKKNGIYLPRSSREQATKGYYVSRSNLRKGDLVFFSTRSSGGKIAHVGIYAGYGKILHTFGAGGVRYSSLGSDWWSSHYITARRVIN
ncbi:C40 family peptidase [Gorillibacterium sp. sgz5001074]|uniref:C40 family peptidase n=1 Tax=Gorillibacterium sp. sgz5001074 TaxID=3446695 RepID=UPI003F66E926